MSTKEEEEEKHSPCHHSYQTETVLSLSLSLSLSARIRLNEGKVTPTTANWSEFPNAKEEEEEVCDYDIPTSHAG